MGFDGIRGSRFARRSAAPPGGRFRSGRTGRAYRRCARVRPNSAVRLRRTAPPARRSHSWGAIVPARPELAMPMATTRWRRWPATAPLQSHGCSRLAPPGPDECNGDAVIRAARLRSATALQAKGLAGCAAVG